VKVDKRFAQGLQFIAHYTFAHANAYNNNYYAISHPVAYGPNDFVRNHVFVFNPVYSLPFGKGKRFLGNLAGPVNYLVGGWQLSNTTNWSSGLPWTPTTNECGAEQDVNICRPNKGSGSFHLGAGSLQHPAKRGPYIQYFTPLTSLGGPYTDAGDGHLEMPVTTRCVGPAGFYFGSVGDQRHPYHRADQRPVSAWTRLTCLPSGVRISAETTERTICVDCQNTDQSNNGRITDIEGGTSMRALQFALRFNF